MLSLVLNHMLLFVDYFNHYVLLFVTPWTHGPGSSVFFFRLPAFSRQEYWSGLPFPSLGDLFKQGTKLAAPMSVGRFFTAEPPRKPFLNHVEIP